MIIMSAAESNFFSFTDAAPRRVRQRGENLKGQSAPSSPMPSTPQSRPSPNARPSPFAQPKEESPPRVNSAQSFRSAPPSRGQRTLGTPLQGSRDSVGAFSAPRIPSPTKAASPTHTSSPKSPQHSEQELHVMAIMAQSDHSHPAASAIHYGPSYRISTPRAGATSPFLSTGSSPSPATQSRASNLFDNGNYMDEELDVPTGEFRRAERQPNVQPVNPVVFFLSNKPTSPVLSAARSSSPAKASPSPDVSKPSSGRSDPPSNGFGTPPIRDHLRSSPVKTRPSFSYGPSV